MTALEQALAETLLAQGKGYGTIAHEISILRGATTVDPTTNRRRGVSKSWVHRELARSKTGTVSKPEAANETPSSSQNGFDVEQRRTIPQADKSTAHETASDREEFEPECFTVLEEEGFVPRREQVDSTRGSDGA